ncbi:MAG TPA: hypothetical protein DCR80_08435, partial [Faecalibacterium sp.]|nr:hypothetical protein [Faecalibacterium sp.]
DLLTVFFGSADLKPLSRCATAPPGGASAPANFALEPETMPPCQRLPLRGSCQNRQVLTEGVRFQTPTVKRQFWKIRRFSRIAKL